MDPEKLAFLGGFFFCRGVSVDLVAFSVACVQWCGCLFGCFVFMFCCKICILVYHCDIYLIVFGSARMVRYGSRAVRFCVVPNFIFMFGYFLYLFVAIRSYRFRFVVFLASCFYFVRFCLFIRHVYFANICISCFCWCPFFVVVFSSQYLCLVLGV